MSGRPLGLAVAGAAALLAAIGAALTIPRIWSASAPAVPHYVEQADAAGLQHVYDGEFFHFVGGGVAAFDCDDDGRQDLYLAGGSRPAALFRNESPVGAELRFQRLPDGTTDLDAVVGAYPIDIDGDGHVDLAVLRIGGNVLLRGLGGCTFESANDRWGVDGGDGWTTAFSATWDSPDSLPTLAFGNYLRPNSVDDRSYVCDDDQLVRPDASGDAYAPSIPLTPGYCSLSMLFSDWNRSGHADLRVSNDRQYYRNGQEQLWNVTPGASPTLWTADDGWQPVKIWGMGIASYDLTGDGYPEVFLTSQADNRLQTLADGPAQPRYRDIAIERGTTAHEPYTGDLDKRSTAWHAEFQDVDNDGLADLFIAKGNVEAQDGYAMRDPSNLLIQQPDGTFAEGGLEAGIASFARARGAVLADLNLDGLLDLVVVNRRVNVSLYRNVGSGDAAEPEPMGNWLAIRVLQEGANRDAIGAWVEVTSAAGVQRREITIGGGHASGELGWLHFGIGAASDATISVQWPDGENGPPLTLDANRFGIVRRGATEVEAWTPNDGGS
ncbi:MAG TPA: CRTAC1 family protein [Candidatus Limnocylindria bacterium]|nr:CRTAC1 family protein [Candidatus Limnocylindria bacterium]